MRGIIFILFFTFYLAKTLMAQTYSIGNNQAAAERIKETTLAVVMKTPDPKFIKFYSKYRTWELDSYKQFIDVYNKYIEEIVVARWNYSPVIEVITEERAEMIKKLGDKTYTLLEFSGYDNSKSTDPSPDPPALVITMARNTRNVVAYENFQEVPLTKGILTFHFDQLVNQLQNSFNAMDKWTPAWKRQVDDRTAELKKKTVLICQNWMTDELREKIEKGNWKQDPMISYKVVTLEELDQHIIDHTKDHAFIFFLGPVYIIVDLYDSGYLYYRSRYIHSSGEIVPKFLEDVSKEVSK